MSDLTFCSQLAAKEIDFEHEHRPSGVSDSRNGAGGTPSPIAWLDEHRYELFGGSDEVTEAQKSELLRRREEYFEDPDRFTRVTSEEELDRFFEDIRREVQARVPSAGPG